MAKAFVIDVSQCCGCYNCQLACKDEHAGNDWTPYAKPQPDTGQFWMKLGEHVCGTVPKVKMHYIPLRQHCENAPPGPPGCHKPDDGWSSSTRKTAGNRASDGALTVLSTGTMTWAWPSAQAALIS